MIAIEQAFSMSESILDEIQSSMAPESLKAQTCVNDWTRAALRTQKIEREENYNLFDFTTREGT